MKMSREKKFSFLDGVLVVGATVSTIFAVRRLYKVLRRVNNK